MPAQDTSISVNGAVIYFSISADSDRRALEHNWGIAGFGDRVPAARRDGSSLRAALQYVFKSHDEEGNARFLVRSLADGGLTVVREDRGTHSNSYPQILAARVTEGGTLDLTFETYDAELFDRITESYQIERDRLTGAQIARAFVDLLKINLGATTLREAGGVYWVPESKLDIVRELAIGIEAASLHDDRAAGSRSQVYILRTAQDETAAKAISAAITAEVTAEIARIEADVADGTMLGARALNTRKEDAKRLRAKVQTYEATIGRAMDVLREGADRAEAEATRAALAAMAQDDADRAT